MARETKLTTAHRKQIAAMIQKLEKLPLTRQSTPLLREVLALLIDVVENSGE